MPYKYFDLLRDQLERNWLIALASMAEGNETDHRTKEFAWYLRSGEPMPQTIRNMLADMLDPPSGAGYIEVTLVPKPKRRRSELGEFVYRRRAVAAFESKRSEDRSEAEALDLAAKWWPFEDKSNFHRMRRQLYALRSRWLYWYSRCAVDK